jgi:hypothetical protein
MAYSSSSTYQNAIEEINKVTEPKAKLTKSFFNNRIKYLEAQYLKNFDPIIRITLKVNIDVYEKIWGPHGK